MRTPSQTTRAALPCSLTTAAYSQARQPILDERLSKRWCLTQYPSKGNAQLAGMSTEAYRNFVWDAVNKDWDAQREHQAQLVDVLEDGEIGRAHV